jgi:hypothetical protein
MINANRLSPAEFAEFVRGSIQTLSEIGIKLSPDFERNIAQNYELNRDGIHHRADPLTAVLRWISEDAVQLGSQPFRPGFEEHVEIL